MFRFTRKDYTVHQRYQTLYCPTNAHNVKNVEVLKQSKIEEAAPACFGLQGKVTPCIKDIRHFIVQPTHTTLKT